MTSIRAAVCREFGKPLTIETVELADPGPGEIEVDVKACAICHSDIIYADGGWGGVLPAVYGHEAAGVVSRIGAGVTRLKPGDRAVVTLIRSCGNCTYRGSGDRVLCEEVFALDRATPLHDNAGSAITHGLKTGAFAEKVVVHESQAAPIPDDVPFEAASLVACGVLTGFGAAVNTAKVRPGATVAVVGCGGLGLNSVQGAAASGASKVIAIDLSDTRLEFARACGATHGFNPRNVDAKAEVMKLTNGRGVNHVFVTVGVKAAFDGAFDYVTKNGEVVIVGMPPDGVFAAYDPSYLASWNQRIVGSKMGNSQVARDVPMLIELYRSGKLKLDELVSGRYPLENINDAIAATKRGDGVRHVVVM